MGVCACVFLGYPFNFKVVSKQGIPKGAHLSCVVSILCQTRVVGGIYGWHLLAGFGMYYLSGPCLVQGELWESAAVGGPAWLRVGYTADGRHPLRTGRRSILNYIPEIAGFHPSKLKRRVKSRQHKG